LKPLDYESETFFEFGVTVTDQGGLGQEAWEYMSVTVEDVNEAPIISSIWKYNHPYYTDRYSFTFTDPDGVWEYNVTSVEVLGIFDLGSEYTYTVQNAGFEYY